MLYLTTVHRTKVPYKRTSRTQECCVRVFQPGALREWRRREGMLYDLSVSLKTTTIEECSLWGEAKGVTESCQCVKGTVALALSGVGDDVRPEAKDNMF